MKITLICIVFAFGLITNNFCYEEIPDFTNKIGWKNKLESHTGCCVSLNQCAFLCCLNPRCSSFFYNDNDARCQLHSDVLNDTSFTVASNGSRYYKCQKDLCPNGWLPYNGYCYFIVTFIQMTWPSAKLYCNGMGGKLVEPRSKDEYIYIQRLLLGLTSYQRAGFWLGGRDSMTEGLWLWDSDEKKINFTAWVNGQPENNVIENYLGLSALHNFKWNDYDILVSLDFICQIKYQGTETNCCRNTKH